jgi:VanZ family protein
LNTTRLYTTRRQRSTAVPLAAVFMLLVVYASLYPFADWRAPPDVSLLGLLDLPWPTQRSRFDDMANLIGYIPLGALVFGAMVRSGMHSRFALPATLAACIALSVGVEVAQNFLPQRVPSMRDVGFNTAGAAIGLALTWWAQWAGVLDSWQRLRERWFRTESAAALALLLLWPVALLFPAPAPLGLGYLWSDLDAALTWLLAGTPWAEPAPLIDAWSNRVPLSRMREGLITALGLLAPCMVAFATAPRAWPRVVLLVGAVLIAAAMSTLSTTLNYGPQHALVWQSPVTLSALAVGVIAALACLATPMRVAAVIGLVTITVMAVLVAQAPTDPYFALNLQSWEQGRFVRFHGLAQWVGWLWPYLAMAWLISRALDRRSGD